MYNNYGFNPYYQSTVARFQQVQPIQQMEQPVQPISTQTYIPPVQVNKPLSLLGKSVDSIEVVKAMDIPLDGSISYFPLTDGSAIVTKQLKSDGTSKTIVYKPIIEEKEDAPRYVTADELEEVIKDIDLSEIDSLKDDIKDLKDEIKNLKEIKKGK